MKLEFKLNPEQNDLDLIRDGIRAYNRMHLPDGDVDAIGCFARNDEGKIVGGLTGEMFNNTVFVEYLWVDAEARTSGVGSKLIALLEEQVKPHGVTHLYLDTYSFQALDFYLKLGFEKVGQYSGYPAAGIDKHFLQKKIA
ncbi:GNAT family N-acetyltransferase [Vibrio campbellii]|uniref:GNAT family N-acetyltransferase n=1 Tax=Vibrio campbellii TaxID=680 RepID=A0AAE9N209_9VIBR|nr:GNAT family N-acetyltransferase [Vibrio campbellii]UTZ29250.1 GNAT family N-acetyltransferase [Vibrio campbellii]UTZ34460.1 GNAT family N-acetyltransferase [Vibrio campbellii]